MELIMAFTLFISFIFCFSTSFVEAGSFSFSAELIHRDSPNSPFFSASETPTTRLANAFERSSNRLNLLYNNPNTVVQSPLISINGEYLIKLSIGTPPIEILVTTATESDLIWIPCVSSTCQNCKGREFNPSQSSSYRNNPCKSYICQITKGVTCRSNNCYFSCGSSTNQDSCPSGDLARDTITLTSTNNQTISLPDSNFICGNNISEDFPGLGFLGLGHGSLSLISQMDHLINGKFSYCLVPQSSNKSSKINFGGEISTVKGDGTVYTPLIQNIGAGSYSIILDEITVQNNTIPIAGIDGPYIDTGSVLSYLPINIYDKLQLQVTEGINQKPVQVNTSSKPPLCYLYTPEFNPPIITLKLRDANLELGPSNTFIRVSQDIVCFAFAPTSGNVAIIGNWQQINFFIGYDLKQGTISFMPTDCTKY